jgi:hypothetical protein
VQRKHADFVVPALVARHLAATSEEHEVGGPVPLLDHVQPFVDFAAQFFGVQIAAQEDGLDRFAKLGKCLIGPMSTKLSPTAK